LLRISSNPLFYTSSFRDIYILHLSPLHLSLSLYSLTNIAYLKAEREREKKERQKKSESGRERQRVRLELESNLKKVKKIGSLFSLSLSLTHSLTHSFLI